MCVCVCDFVCAHQCGCASSKGGCVCVCALLCVFVFFKEVRPAFCISLCVFVIVCVCVCVFVPLLV